MKLKRTIGAHEKIDFPVQGFKAIDARVDTGAMSSSINSKDIKIVKKGKLRKRYLKCYLLDDESKYHYFKKFKKRIIKNSFGHKEKRYVVMMPVQIFDQTYNTEFTLSNRVDMNFKVLLGRRFIRFKFTVDVAQSNVSFHLKQKAQKKEDL